MNQLTLFEESELPCIGARLRLLQDIWDNGEDHHPPGYCARSGDIVVVRRTGNNKKWFDVSHVDVLDSAFTLYIDDIFEVCD